MDIYNEDIRLKYNLQYEGFFKNQSNSKLTIIVLPSIICRLFVPFFSGNIDDVSSYELIRIIAHGLRMIIDQIMLKCLIHRYMKSKYFLILSFLTLNLYILIFQSEGLFLYYLILSALMRHCNFGIVTCILDCSSQNPFLVQEYLRLESIPKKIFYYLEQLVTFFFVLQLIIYKKITMCDVIFILTKAISAVHYIYLNKQQQKYTKNISCTYSNLIFFSYAIINPPWMNLNAFVDKNQIFYKKMIKYNLFYKQLLLFIILLKQVYLIQINQEKTELKIIIISLLVIILLSYLRELIQLKNQSKNSTEQTRLNNQYQLTHRHSNTDEEELNLLNKWCPQFHNHLIVDYVYSYLFIQLLFKQGNLKKNKEIIYQEYSSKLLVIDNQTIQISQVNSRQLFITSLLFIYNLMRYRQDQSLKQLPDINNPEEVNEYFKHFQVVKKDIYANQIIKKIILKYDNDQKDEVDAEYIFFIKFLNNIFEHPLVQILVPEKNLQIFCNNRYQSFIQQISTHILFRKIDYLFPMNPKLILYDLFEEYK